MRSQSAVHFLPCDQNYDGPAEVQAFFKTEEQEQEQEQEASGGNKTMRGALLGRELEGETMGLSQDGMPVQGLFLTKAGCGMLDEDEGTQGGANKTKLRIMGRFHSMTVWQHDAKPEVAKMREYVDWFAISNAVHS